MLIFERDIAIDLGTSMTLVYVRGKGVVLREPTVVAVDTTTGKLKSVGTEAENMLGRTPANIAAITPIADGVISDYDMTAHFLRDLISRITSATVFKPRVIVCIPSSITGVEERAVIDATIEAGARKVYLVESAVATATGAGIDISKAEGHMVIDIGGGTTEIAVVSLGGVVECQSIKVGSSAFDEALIKYIRKKHNVLIGMRTAEELKRTIGCVAPKKELGNMEVKGRNIKDGLPKSIEISPSDMMEAYREPVEAILEAIHMVLERTPPELVGDISVNGIVMSGGGSLLWGLDKLITSETGIESIVVDDPIACAAYGAGKMLRNIDDMQDGMVNLARRKKLK